MQTWILVLRTYSQSTEFVCGWDSLLISLLTSREKAKQAYQKATDSGSESKLYLRSFEQICSSGDYHPKEIIAVVVEFTAIGYLTLEINEILENGSGWWRLYDDLHLKRDKDFYYVDLESHTSLM